MVPTCKPGTILGHEGIGVIDSVGSGVIALGRCEYCSKGMNSHCTAGCWMLGYSIDGTQAEFVLIPHADTSLYPIPKALPGADDSDEEALVMLSGILPAGFACGVLNGKVQVGGSVAIAGSGPIGLAALSTAQLYSPSEIFMVALDDNRFAVAKTFGATAFVNSNKGDTAV